MSFSELMNLLFSVKEKAPSMRWEPTMERWGESKVVITIPVTDENAELLIQAQQMFAPREDYDY